MASKYNFISVILLILFVTVRCIRTPRSCIDVCRGGSEENKEKPVSNDLEHCGDEELKNTMSKYRLFITLPNNTKVMKSFDSDDEKTTLKAAVHDILQELSAVSDWKLHVKRPLPQKIITKDNSEMDMSLLRIGNGMDVTIVISEGSSEVKSSDNVVNRRKGISAGIRRRTQKRRGKAMTLESSGHYAASDKRKKKNNEYSTGGNTVMLSGDEEDDDDDDDDDDDEE